MRKQGIDFETVADTTLDCFEWLTQRDFVELVQSRYRLDDVARDVFRLSLYQEDRNQFRHAHELLAKYFEEQANQEVSSESPAHAKYENPDWRQYTAEFLYHALFAKRDEGQRQFLSHLFASRYLKQIDVVITPLLAIAAEAVVENYWLLPTETEKFLESIKLVFPLGWVALEADPGKYEINYENGTGPSKEEIEAALRNCLNQVGFLKDGLGKYAGLLYKSLRCRTLAQRVDLLLKAKEQAERIALATYSEFSSNLLFEVGYGLYQLRCYEEAIASYDKALAIKDNFPEVWYNRGNALADLGLYGEAIASYKEALAIKDDFPEVWDARGAVLGNLGRYEEAIDSCNAALTIKHEFAAALANRGAALYNLGRYEEALASYKEALAIKNDDPKTLSNRSLVLSRLDRYDEALADLDKALQLKAKDPLLWANQGIVLARAGRYEEALASCDKALELQPDDESGYYGKACCYALQGDSYMAIENLQQAITLNPHRCHREAKTNPDFDSLRADNRFQALMQEKTD